LINEIGTRLEFDVMPGHYQGRRGESGHDGLWRSASTKQNIVVEAKTTDAYRVDLDRIWAYRMQLLREHNLEPQRTSLLLVVGRNDTTGLEAQVRGSRYAWDTRIVSATALARLPGLRQRLDDDEVVSRIGAILTPQEFTRVDGIIELVFSTTADAVDNSGNDEPPEPVDSDDAEKYSQDKHAQERAKLAAMEVARRTTRIPFVLRGRSWASGPGGELLLISYSKWHEKPNRYWFGFHPSQKAKLNASKNAWLAFACADQGVVILPIETFEKWLPGCWKTWNGDRNYWHIVIRIEPDNKPYLMGEGDDNDVLRVDVSSYFHLPK
jgi:hypothetical protein